MKRLRDLLTRSKPPTPAAPAETTRPALEAEQAARRVLSRRNARLARLVEDYAAQDRVR